MIYLLVVGLFFAVLVLASKLHETRHQLDQARGQRNVYSDAYERLLMSAIIAGHIANPEKEHDDALP